MATTHSDTDKASPRGLLIDHVGPALGLTPRYELSIDQLADALGYIAKRMTEDNKGKVIAEVSRGSESGSDRDDDADDGFYDDTDSDTDGEADSDISRSVDSVSFTIYYAAPLQSVLSEWEADYAEELEGREQSIKMQEGHLAEYQAIVDRVEKMGKWEKFRFSLSSAAFKYEVAQRAIIPFLGPLLSQDKAGRDSLKAEIDAFREKGYLVKDNEDGTSAALYPYAQGLTLDASAGDTRVTITVHDQETEAESITNYRAGLMLAGALMARMPEGLEVVLERGQAEWGYEVPIEDPQDDEDIEAEEVD